MTLLYWHPAEAGRMEGNGGRGFAASAFHGSISIATASDTQGVAALAFENVRPRFPFAALTGIVVAFLVACGGGTANNVTTVTQTVEATQTVPATNTEPTRVRGSVGVAGNAPFAEWQLTNYDPTLVAFGDSYAPEFCKKPEAFYSLNVSGQSIPYEWSFYQSELGKPSGSPPWADDLEVKTMIGQYMVTHYCPWTD